MHGACACVCPSVSQTVVQHLLRRCHAPLHSSSRRIKVTSLCIPGGARQPPDAAGHTLTHTRAPLHSDANKGCALSIMEVQEIRDVLLQRHVLPKRNQQKAGVCPCRAPSGPLVEATTATCEWKNPTGTPAVHSSVLAGQVRDGLQQTHQQKGCPTQLRDGEFSGKAANIC